MTTEVIVECHGIPLYIKIAIRNQGAPSQVLTVGQDGKARWANSDYERKDRAFMNYYNHCSIDERRAIVIWRKFQNS